MIRASVGAAALAALAFAFPLVAAADAPPAPAPSPAPDKQDAQSLMQSGVKLLEAKDYLGALAVFKTAYERFPAAKILLNIGTALKLLGRDADAANAYQRFVDAHDTDAKRRAEIQKLVEKIDKTVGRLDIVATPSDAVVVIDDDDWLHVVHAASWRVAPGHHTVSVKRDGFEPKSKSIDLAAGDTVALEINLVAVPAPVAVAAVDATQATGLVAHAVPAEPEPPRGRLGALVFGHFDIPHGGAALVGLTADLTDRIAVRGAGILGPHFGGYAGAVVAILPHVYRPYVSAGVPVFVSHGARYGVRGAAGFEYELSRHLAISIEAGVEHTFDPEMGVKATAFVPAAGVVGRL